MKLYQLPDGALVTASSEEDLKLAETNKPLAETLKAEFLNTIKLQRTAMQFHWNVIGRQFKEIHEFFDEEYRSMLDDFDALAEALRSTGYVVPDTLQEKSENQFSIDQILMAYKKALVEDIQLLGKVNDEAEKQKNLSVMDLVGSLSGKRSKSLYKVCSTLGEGTQSLEATASTKIEAAFDADKFREFKDENQFFQKLREGLGDDMYSLVGVRGFKKALGSIRQSGGKAVTRFFYRIRKGDDNNSSRAYMRIEEGKDVYIVGYTIYSSDKVRVWTRKLRRNIVPSRFKITDIDRAAEPESSPLPKGLLRNWLLV